MKAIALTKYLPITEPESLFDTELPKPSPTGRDLLVSVRAISVNPVDTKIRAPKPNIEATPRVLGWDAAGVVEAVGPDVTGFKAGDEVFYAGDITRAGSNAEYQLVDERIVGRRPATLSFAQSAAFPLVTLTAWEALFDRLGIDPQGKDHAGRTLLIISGAGGVGSMAIQLAKRAGLVVIATASRPETVAWVRELGADHILDHRQPLVPQLAALGHAEVDFIANFFNTDSYWTTMAELIRPQGKIVSIVENDAPLDLDELKAKSATFVWEFMFTRSKFQTPDMAEQGLILSTVAGLIDDGKIQRIDRETLSPINAANLREAHARLESQRNIGKLVLENWPESTNKQPSQHPNTINS